MKDQEQLTFLFKKYIAQRCSADEIQQLFELINQKENDDHFFSLVTAEFSGDVPKAEDIEGEKKAVAIVKTTLLNEIHSPRLSSKSPASKVIKKLQSTWFKVAALWLFVGSVTLFLFYRHFTDNYTAKLKQSTKTLVTRTGQKKMITLFDGTKIWLSPSSTLQYTDQLISSFREVTLDGEAFFEVAKDKRHPFIVHSGAMQTEVVGTSFNVKSYLKGKDYTVTVVTGVVKVAHLSAASKKLSQVILRPNQQVVFTPHRPSLIASEVPDTKPVLQKRNGILSYNGTPITEVVADLNRYYDTHIIMQKPSFSCLCYGEFNTTRPISIVLRQLSTAIGANVLEKEGQYILEGGCDER